MSLYLGFNPYALVNPRTLEDATLLVQEAERTLQGLHASILELDQRLIVSKMLGVKLDEAIKHLRAAPASGAAPLSPSTK